MDNSDKIILDLCGGTGAWSEPYQKAGYTVYVITLPDYDIANWYIEGDCLVFPCMEESKTIYVPLRYIYGILAAPTCTQFSRARTRAKTIRDCKEGMILVRLCTDIILTVQEIAIDEKGIPLLKFWALENPLGVLRRYLGRPDYSYDPCDFGDPWTKKTDLWGWFDKPTKIPVEISEENRKLLKDNNRVMPGKEIGLKYSERRSITPPGFAEAFFRANQ